MLEAIATSTVLVKTGGKSCARRQKIVLYGSGARRFRSSTATARDGRVLRDHYEGVIPGCSAPQESESEGMRSGPNLHARGPLLVWVGPA